MSEMKVFSVMEQEEPGTIHIDYHRPLFSKRIFAHLFDMLLALLIGVGIFTLTRFIVSQTESYKTVEKRVEEVTYGSGLYVEVEGQRQDAVSYYSKQDLSSFALMNQYQDIISTFIEFTYSKSQNAGDIVQEDYDSYRLNFSYEDTKMFITDSEGEIVINSALKMTDKYQYYCDNVYEPYIDIHLQSYLLSLYPTYYDDVMFTSRTITFIELPIAVVLACLLTYLVPPLLLKRGRQTLGMLLFRIGRTGSDLLALPLGRFLAYEAIWIFGIIVLSFVTIGVPLLVSFIMMCVTKTKQDFGEYMLQINTIDVTDHKIYYSLYEIDRENDSAKQVSASFEAENRL